MNRRIVVPLAGIGAGHTVGRPAAPEPRGGTLPKRASAPLLWLALLAFFTPYPALAQERVAEPFQPPDDIEFRTADVMSEGVRLNAEIFAPAGSTGRLPTIISAHGWGGTAALLRNDAVDMARTGYLVINFDYRGWGQSDGRVVLASSLPAREDRSEPFSAEVTELRGYIDPYEQVEDWFNTIDWAVGDARVDPERIGLRGTSYSGGHVVYVAALDPRVKAIVSQVGATDIARGIPQMYERAEQEATRRARGETGYPDPFVREFNLTGLPLKTKGLRYSPNSVAERVDAAALFIVAEHEELYTNASQAEIAYARVRGPKEYYVVPGITHYAVYGDAREEVVRRAVEWFDRHLR